MFRNRRFACLILGMWLGAAVCVDAIVSQNVAAGDRFIAAPGSVATATLVKQANPKSVRLILQRNAEDENTWIYEVWERVQTGIAVAYFFLILFGERPPKSALALIPIMLLIVLIQYFVLTPNLASLGRDVGEIPAKELMRNPIVGRYRAFSGFFLGSEILKFLVGLAAGARLMVRRTLDRTSLKDQQLERIMDRDIAQMRVAERRRKPRRATDVPTDRMTDRNG